MKIDGRAIADKILANLPRTRVTPILAVIQVGNDKESTIYINQKKKAASRIGATIIHKQYPLNVSENKLKVAIQTFNRDQSIHGIILQQPLPPHLNATFIYQFMKVEKDVDGFEPNSPYTPPVAAAVMTILNAIGQKPGSCVVIGRGETAGSPIAETLGKNGWNVSVVHSQTENPEEIIKKAHVVISCVGKGKVVTADMVHKNTILIGVGRGDYDEEEIKDIVAYYTPTPGGVGPVNVACLMQNLIKACKMTL